MNATTYHHELSQNGFLHLPAYKSDLVGLISNFGEAFRKDEIKITHDSKRLLNSEHTMPFHCDHPDTKVILWKCLKQTSEGGASLLIDIEKIILNEFSAEEREVLSNIKIKIPESKSFASLFDKESKGICYTPWLIKRSDLSSEEALALKKLQTKIEEAEILRILLQPGDILIINNKKVLHSRESIKGNKDRLLVRYWIK